MTEPDHVIEARIATRLAAISAGTVEEIPLPPVAYVRRHLVEHAAAGNLLAEVLSPALMPYVDAVRLRSVVAEHGEQGWRSDVFRAWRRVAHRWDYDRPALNAVLLRLARSDAGLNGEADVPTAAETGAWSGRWAAWPPDAAEVIGTHAGPVTAAALTTLNDRPVIVSGSRDRSVRAWNVVTGEPVGVPLEGHTDWVTAIAVAELPAGPVALSGSRDRTVRLWDLRSGRALGTLSGHRDAVTALAATVLDGRWVGVSGSEDETLRLWDLSERRSTGVLRDGNGRITSIAVVGGGRLAVVGAGNSTVRVWDLAAGTPVDPPLTAPAGDTRPTQTGRHDNQPTPVAVGQVGERIVALAGTPDNTVGRWNIDSGDSAGPDLAGHTDAVTAIAVVAGHDPQDDPIAVTGSRDHTLRVWNLATGETIGDPLHGHTGTVNVLVPVPKTPVLVTGAEDGTLRAWDLSAGQQPSAAHRVIRAPIDAVTSTLVGDRAVAVTGDRSGGVTAWDIANGERPFPAIAGHDKGISAIATARLAGRSIVLTGSRDRTLRAWDVETGEPVGVPCGGHTVRVTAVAATVVADRLIAVASGYDKTPRVWDVDSGRQVGELVGHDNVVNTVAIVEVSGRPLVVTGGADRTIRVWDLASRALVAAPLVGHAGPVLTLTAASVAGAAVIVSGARDGAIMAWPLDPPTGSADPAAAASASASASAAADVAVAVGRPLGRHAAAVTSVVTITSDIRTIAVSCGEDDLVRLWDVATGEPVDEPLPVPGAVRGLATTGSPPVAVVLAGYGISVVQLDPAFIR